MTDPILRLESLHKRFGDAIAAQNFSLEIDSGEFFTFLGPSGSGKSSILRMIAGLEPPDSGRVILAGKDMGKVPPWRRNLGFVFQSYAVFPHMNVAQNVGYGLRMHKRPKAEIDTRVEALLSLVGLAGMAARDVVRLSGGEQQRVALARALAMEPAILLLDEPLSALDEKIRREMQHQLKRIQRQTGTTFIYVTHDQEEALTMSDRIAVINHGDCVQCDAPEALFRRPRTRFVANFFRGCNVLETDCSGAGNGEVTLGIAGNEVRVPLNGREWSSRPRVHVALRAETPHVGDGAADCDVVLEARIVDVMYRGTNVDHVFELDDGQQLLATATRRQVAEGQVTVLVGFNADGLVLLDD